MAAKTRINISCVFLMTLIFLPVYSDAANPCFSTLSDDLRIHIPVLNFSGTLLTAGIDYSATGPASDQALWFKVSDLDVSDLNSCSNPAKLFFDSGTFILRIPVLIFGIFMYWIELEYFPTTDGQIWLKSKDFGLLSNFVFITSVTGNGNLGSWADAGGKTGLAAGDAICQARAQAAGLSGTFVAWLSDSKDDAYCRVHGLDGKKSANCGQASLPTSAGPWIRTDGFPFSGRIDLLTQWEVYSPLRHDEYGGVTLDRRDYIFTDTRIDGTAYSETSCSDWTLAGSDMVTGGGTQSTFRYWTDIVRIDCSSTLRIACFQAGSGPDLPLFESVGKKVFVSSQTTDGNIGGLSGADALCQNLADAAGLTGTFKAWLSDSSTNAVDRLSSSGPWVRIDGVRIADDKADLTDGILFTAISVDEMGSYTNYNGTWTGTDQEGNKTITTCSDWQSNLDSDKGLWGSNFCADRGWTDNRQSTCDMQLKIYCFED